MENPCEKVTNEQVRVELRERFLRLMSSLSGGTSCNLKLYDNGNYKCKIKGFDSAFENMIVEDLVTPHPILDGRAIIRMNDVISIKCEANHL